MCKVLFFLGFKLGFVWISAWESLSPRSKPPVGSTRWVGAVVMTNTGLDHHDSLADQAAPWTAKGDCDSAGPIRRATSAISAEATVTQTVKLCAVAALMEQACGNIWPVARLAFPWPHWCLIWQSLAWSDFTQPDLLLKSAGCILVAHSCGDSWATSTWAGTPLCTLIYTV